MRGACVNWRCRNQAQKAVGRSPPRHSRAEHRRGNALVPQVNRVEHRASWRPFASAWKLLPLSTTQSCRQPLCANANWYSRCGKASPAMVIGSSSHNVELERPSRPGGCSRSKKDLAFTAVLGAPLMDSALQRPPHCPIEALGIPQLQFLQHGHRHQARRRPQHRRDLGQPDIVQRIDARAPTVSRLWEGSSPADSMRRALQTWPPPLGCAYRLITGRSDMRLPGKVAAS